MVFPLLVKDQDESMIATGFTSTGTINGYVECSDRAIGVEVGGVAFVKCEGARNAFTTTTTSTLLLLHHLKKKEELKYFCRMTTC